MAVYGGVDAVWSGWSLGCGVWGGGVVRVGWGWVFRGGER